MHSIAGYAYSAGAGAGFGSQCRRITAARLNLPLNWLHGRYAGGPQHHQHRFYASSTWGLYNEPNAVVGAQSVWSGITDTGTGSEANTIDGGDGDDTIIAGHGNDRIQGGTDNDTPTGLEGDNILEGGEGDDRIEADGMVVPDFFSSVAPDKQGQDFVDGGAGADKILGGGKADVLDGDATTHPPRCTKRVTRRRCIAITSIAHYSAFAWARWRFESITAPKHPTQPQAYPERAQH